MSDARVIPIVAESDEPEAAPEEAGSEPVRSFEQVAMEDAAFKEVQVRACYSVFLFFSSSLHTRSSLR